MAEPTKPHHHGSRNRLDADYLRQILHYSPETGVLTWKDRRDIAPGPNSRLAGTVAGSINPYGHRQIMIHGRFYVAHCIAWAIMKGQWPDHQIDHKNTDPDDNRWDNLRASDSASNAWNRKNRSDSTSGVKGVSQRIVGGKWRAYINKHGKRHYLGDFATIDEAVEARRKAAEELHGDFVNHG